MAEQDELLAALLQQEQPPQKPLSDFRRALKEVGEKRLPVPAFLLGQVRLFLRGCEPDKQQDLASKVEESEECRSVGKRARESDSGDAIASGGEGTGEGTDMHETPTEEEQVV
eukprot:CAMPEP_0113909380 /NCGR_PEP_ID=MMETSP0780_2-20120614/26805_1 /TAXON_ID=652834 /ORGANISM="Palpitomonas bilix" /LENGTH=112 /DNA_ID=CAMNT_0000905153 /DNA_START=29 /DNA_END=364 /DNA_ORIENTATION=- /assembly_acc=CAM_ASM_000599